MARFCGEVGFGETVDVGYGEWVEKITERRYYGDVVKASSRMQTSENLNDNLNVDNRISIVADAFAMERFHEIRYIRWLGSLWKITYVEIQRPRLVMTMGGVYNGREAT